MKNEKWTLTNECHMCQMNPWRAVWKRVALAPFITLGPKCDIHACFQKIENFLY
jgi:hypothetical protein